MTAPGKVRGLALGHEVRSTMSASAVRRTGRYTRPSLRCTPPTPMTELGLRLGVRYGRGVYSSLEEVVLLVAPPRAGKDATLGNFVADAPGAVVATSTKADMYRNTVAYRAGRPVVIFNPDQLGDIWSNLRWSPVTGCGDPQTATLRAGHLLGGAATGGMSDKSYWESNAVRALRCLLMAAALDDKSMRDVFRWAGLVDKQPLSVLTTKAPKSYGATWAADLKSLLDAPPKTRDSISITITGALQFMADPVMAEAVCPSAGQTVFDAGEFLAKRGTLYLLGTEREHGAVGPLFAALAGYVYESAKLLASKASHGRLDPPLLMCLNEAASICRVPLDQWSRDAGSHGIPLVVAVQNPDQLYAAWGDHGGNDLWSNAAVKLIYGGLTNPQHLDQLSDLCGTYWRRSRSHSTNSGGRNRSVSVDQVPVLTPSDIRTLPKGTMLALHRTSRPVLLRYEPIWDRKPKQAATSNPPTGPIAPVVRMRRGKP